MLLLPSSLLSIPVDPLVLIVEAALTLYAISLLVLTIIAGQGVFLLCLQRDSRGQTAPKRGPTDDLPVVTIQLPVFNELFVVERLIHAVCRIDHPREKLEIQVLDDSTDGTVPLISRLVGQYRAEGFDIHHIRRSDRAGFKAGALQQGLERSRGEFIAIFDADFVPRTTFLKDTLPVFGDVSVGMVQTRWEHLNELRSPLTRTQAFAFDGHFAMDQRVRSSAGHFLTFNGTGGVWRKRAIIDAGAWQNDTLTEDLDLSYRAQLRGWRLVFRNDITSPAELPADFNAFRAQQYRWTKGYIETARKILPLLWRSSLPLPRKMISTLHLCSNIAFPIMLLVAVMNAPMAMIRTSGGHETYFMLLSVCALGFVSTFIFYLQAQRFLHTRWIRRLAYFPLFLAGSMGLAVSNTKAVLEGLSKSARTFVRTPKCADQGIGNVQTSNAYSFTKPNTVVFVEIILSLYCFLGVVFSLYQAQFMAVPFQLLFATGFSMVAWLSVSHARAARRSETT